MIEVHQNYSLDLANNEVFYARRSFEPSGQAPHFCLPNWWNGFLPRILHGAWFLNAYTRPVDGKAIRFKAPEAHHFVAWQLEEGEAVCFNYQKLVGFSCSIQLRTEISLRLSSFAMNRILFPIAIGPGLLVMETVGKPSIVPQDEAPDAQPPSRLVCWSAETVFELEASKGVINDYLSPTYLKPIESKGVVIDADDKSLHTDGMLKRLVRAAFPRG